MSFFAITIIALSTFTCPQSGQADSFTTEDSAAKCSVFESPLANARAWQKGDVLVRTHTSFDTINKRKGIDENGVSIWTESWNRVVFDFETGKFCNLSYTVTSELDLASPDGSEVATKIARYGYCCESFQGRIFQRRFPGELVEAKRHLIGPQKKDLVGYIAFPDFRGIAFMLGGSEDSLEYAEKLGERFKTGELLRSYSSSDDKEIELKLEVYSDERKTNFCTFHFDVKSLMPKSYTSFSEMSKPFPNGDTRANGPSGSWKWQLVNSVYLPKEWNASTGKKLTLNQREHMGRLHSDHEFHWFSLNEDLDEKLFDGSCLKDLESFMLHVDPAKCGADSLIETKKGDETGDKSNSAVQEGQEQKGGGGK